MTLRPFVRPMSSHILDVAATSGGEFAVLTGAGVEIVDASLEPTVTIPGPGPGARADMLVALDDGRFLTHPWGLGSLYVGARGGELSSVDAGGERFFRHVAPTVAGFVATTGERALVDRLGERRWVDLPKGYVERGAVRWREGAIVSGHDGFAVLDASGEVEQTFGLPFGGRPSVVGAAVAFTGLEGAFLFDGGAPKRVLSTLLGQHLTPFESGLLDHCDRRLTYWRFGEGAPAWCWSGQVDFTPPEVFGERIAIVSYDLPVAWVLDRDGATVAEVALPGGGLDAHAFGDGVVFRARQGHELLWWRGAAGTVALEHDVEPSFARRAGGALFSAESNLLYCWRVGTNGPEVPALDPGGLPFDTPIVVGNTLLTLRRGGRFALRAVRASGELTGVQPGSAFRLPVTRQEALDVVGQLIASRFDTYRYCGHDGPGSPVPFEELGAALGVPERTLVAAVRARKFPLEPPRAIEGFEYVGPFTTGGDLVIGDPCHLAKSSKPKRSAFPLWHNVSALEGRFHAFIRTAAYGALETAELVVVHETGFDVLAADPVGSVGVDAGMAGVFDRSLTQRFAAVPLDSLGEGAVFGLGAVASTGGDGFFGAYAGSKNGRVAKIRIFFRGPTPPELDTTVAPVKIAPRPYVTTERFVAGDAIAHKKFGVGTVIRALPDGKIEAMFGDERRVLAHGVPR